MTMGGQQHRVPAEHRFLGLDTRTFRYAVPVVAVFLLMTVLVPRINDAIEWNDPVNAGEQLALSDTLSFTPTTGWNVETGFRVGAGGSGVTSGPAVLAGDGVIFRAEPGSFDGTASDLLEQVKKVTSATNDPSFQVDGDPATVTTVTDDVGVVQTYRSVFGDGVVAALVIDGTGVKVTAYGPPAQMTAAASDIEAMITSIRSTAGSDA